MKASIIQIFAGIIGLAALFVGKEVQAAVWIAAGFVIWALRKDDE